MLHTILNTLDPRIRIVTVNIIKTRNAPKELNSKLPFPQIIANNVIEVLKFQATYIHLTILQ